MLRLAEIGLFLLPFAMYALWRVLGARSTPFVLWGTLACVLALAGITAWYGLSRALPRGEAYVPARLEDGHIVPGHGAAHRSEIR